MEIHPARLTVIADHLGGEGVQMRLVAGRDLQGTGIDLDEILCRQPAAERRLNAVAREKGGAADAGRVVEVTELDWPSGWVIVVVVV